ncbi:MAG: chain-length determining protein [Gammaproteobacteria bacterium]|nr:chain-length determining protein [Gammaproteobacteria bacterium]
MHETIAHLQQQIAMVLRHRWIALTVAFAICIAGWSYVFVMPNKYESSARVFLNTESTLRPVLKGLAVNADISEKMAIATRRTLLNRPNLEKVARGTDLDLKAKTPTEFEKLLTELKEAITIEGRGGARGSNIYEITYENRDAKTAKRVVEMLLSIFVEDTLGATRKDTSLTQKFLDDQIVEYEARLEEAELRLEEFKRKNVGMMPTQAGGYFARLQAAQEALRKAQLEAGEIEHRKSELKRQLAGETPVIRSARQPLAQQPSAVEQRLNSLQTKLDDLLLQYTEKHPDVIAARRTLKVLEERRQAELAQDEEPTTLGSDSANNPIYQELKIVLSKIEAQASGVNVRVNEYKKRVAELRRLVDTIPKVEAELARLNRDYNVTKLNYEKLLTRRESAKISREAALSTDEVQFKIIDPPVVPLVPVSPNRLQLLALIFIVGLGAGAGLAWLLSSMRSIFMNRSQLHEITGLPVLGTVSRVSTDAQLSRQRLMAVLFSLACVGLLAMFAAVMAVVMLNIDVLAHIENMMGGV